MNKENNNWVKLDGGDFSTIDPAYKFPFELDKFQKDAMVGIENNRNVLVAERRTVRQILTQCDLNFYEQKTYWMWY